MDAGPLLRLAGLRTEFETPRGVLRAVDGVDLSLAAGETLAIVGESGSGKSVTALSILRLFTRADRARVAGRIEWRARDGRLLDLASLGERGLRDLRGREIAVVFQDPSASLDPVFSIGAQIREVVRRLRPGEDPAARAVALLRDVGIADPGRRIHAFPHQLSGGMRQRATIAMALAGAPRLLIADEPTTALDVTIQSQILRLLADLQRRDGLALLFITHDLALVAGIADRVASRPRATARPGRADRRRGAGARRASRSRAAPGPRRWRRPRFGAGSGWRRDPGTPSACGGAAAASPPVWRG